MRAQHEPCWADCRTAPCPRQAYSPISKLSELFKPFKILKNNYSPLQMRLPLSLQRGLYISMHYTIWQWAGPWGFWGAVSEIVSSGLSCGSSWFVARLHKRGRWKPSTRWQLWSYRRPRTWLLHSKTKASTGERRRVLCACAQSSLIKYVGGACYRSFKGWSHWSAENSHADHL